jgi:hypothetical protein
MLTYNYLTQGKLIPQPFDLGSQAGLRHLQPPAGTNYCASLLICFNPTMYFKISFNIVK